jgi:RecA-family ATPase
MEFPPYSVTRLARVQARTSSGWLIEDLWSESAVGCLGGAPKSGKTWLALEIAFAVASGKPCLGRFAVRSHGPVLYFAAEDSPQAVRERGVQLAKARSIDLDQLPVGLLDEPTIRLDDPKHQYRLRATCKSIRPKLLILDPFVRLHSADENSASQIAEILGFLRSLQKDHGVSILLVHHVRKNAAGQPGQSLRGSGDLHAWGDSNLYIVQQAEKTILHVEHRSQPAPQPMVLHRMEDPVHLQVYDSAYLDLTMPLEKKILEALRTKPMSRIALRDELKVRNETLGQSLERLLAAGRIRRDGQVLSVPVPAPAAGTGIGNEPRQT